MKKHEFKGLKKSTFPKEVKDMFEIHMKMIGEGSYTWAELFLFLVMENNRFPVDYDVEAVCTDFFSALHSGDIDRGMGNYAQTIEAHVKEFGKWIPRYVQQQERLRASEIAYRHDPIPDIPKPSEAVTKQNWNLMRGMDIGQIKRTLATYDMLMSAPDNRDKQGRVIMGVRGIDSFANRCRKSVERYEIAFSEK